MRKVLVFGTFDRLHRGHLYFLRQARRHGNYLVAVVTRDLNVKGQKGHLPAQKERSRMSALKRIADEVLLGERKVTYNLIKKIKPDVICIGYDQRPRVLEARKILRRIGVENVELRKIKPYKKSVYKTSLLDESR